MYRYLVKNVSFVKVKVTLMKTHWVKLLITWYQSESEILYSSLRGKLLTLQLLPCKVPKICRRIKTRLYISNNKNRTQIQEMYILLQYIHTYSLINIATVKMWVIAHCLSFIIAHWRETKHPESSFWLGVWYTERGVEVNLSLLKYQISPNTNTCIYILCTMGYLTVRFNFFSIACRLPCTVYNEISVQLLGGHSNTST